MPCPKWVSVWIPDRDQAVFVMELLGVEGHSAERVWKQTMLSKWEFDQPSTVVFCSEKGPLS